MHQQVSLELYHDEHTYWRYPGSHVQSLYANESGVLWVLKSDHITQ